MIYVDDMLKMSMCRCGVFVVNFKSYLHYKTITAENVSSEAQVKHFLIL